jgi:ubiquinone/menaquinone biosynthesis C-methylase UbiE/DNA-binding transcriptional ArsR family regulator
MFMYKPNMEQLLSALRAAGEPTRLRILAILALGELTVSELTQVLLQSQPRISRHLKLLADAGLVQRNPEGSWVFYRLHEGTPIASVLPQIIGHIPDDDHDILRDRERFAEVRQLRAERAQNYFAANAGSWDELRARHFFFHRGFGNMARQLEAHGGAMNLLVDLGTGTGRMLEIFGHRADRAIGFDVSPDMLTLARSKLDEVGAKNCQVRQGDCANVPLEDNVASIVILHQVLHFLDDPQRALNEAARILAPGGSVLIADFGPHEMEALRDEHAHRRLGFSDADMRAMLAHSGLQIAQTQRLSPESRHSEQDLTVVMWQAQKPETLEDKNRNGI